LDSHRPPPSRLLEETGKDRNQIALGLARAGPGGHHDGVASPGLLPGAELVAIEPPFGIKESLTDEVPNQPIEPKARTDLIDRHPRRFIRNDRFEERFTE
jgi:hypothetical protein